jgi:hypothetical protein
MIRLWQFCSTLMLDFKCIVNPCRLFLGPRLRRRTIVVRTRVSDPNWCCFFATKFRGAFTMRIAYLLISLRCVT